MQIHIRTAALAPESEARLLETVRGEIRAVDPNLPILALKTMRAHLDASFDLWIVRTGARIFMIFGGVALLLAAIGLYGVRAYNVAQRTRGIGIRMALGASSSDAVRMMLREGLALMGVGAAIGLLLSVAVGKALSTLLLSRAQLRSRGATRRAGNPGGRLAHRVLRSRTSRRASRSDGRSPRRMRRVIGDLDENPPPARVQNSHLFR